MSDNIKKLFSIFVGLLLMGFLFGWGPAKSLQKIWKGSPESVYINYDAGGSSNVNFQGNETSRKRGKPCHHRDYGVGNYSECSDKLGGCSGFSSMNRDPRTCSKCGHRVEDHY